MGSSLLRALALAVVGTTLIGWLWAIGARAALAWLCGIAVLVLLGAAALAGRDWLAERLRRLYDWTWSDLEGRHHSFAGVRLRVEDDGRHVWIDGRGLMRATGREEPEDVLAARHAGHWRRGADGTLQLRVDDVVRQLSTGRERDTPRIQRLRRYLERDVLFPAARRRERR